MKRNLKVCLVATILLAPLLHAPGEAHAQSLGSVSLPGIIHLGGSTLGGVTGAVGGVVGGAVGGVVGTAGNITSGALGGGGGMSGAGAVTGATGLAGAPADGGAPSLSGGSDAAGLVAALGPGTGAVTPIALPAALLPRHRRLRVVCRSTSGRAGRCPLPAPIRGVLHPQPGTPLAVVQACRNTVVASALKYGVARVDAASAGRMGRSARGYDAPVTFRILYDRRTGPEVRQATIDCRLNQAGRVIAAL